MAVFDYSRNDNLYGGLITHRMPNDTRDVRFAYDRLSFYPNLLLSINDFPSNAEVEDKYLSKKKIKTITFSVKAARRKNKNGIFFKDCVEVLAADNVTMFEEEFKTIFKKEFIIWHLEILSVDFLNTVTKREDFRDHFRKLLIRKEQARGTSQYTMVKSELNTEIGGLSLKKNGDNNGNLDKLSYAYLQSKARIEMYKLCKKHGSKIINFFVDTVYLAEDIEELHNKKVWRIA